MPEAPRPERDVPESSESIAASRRFPATGTAHIGSYSLEVGLKSGSFARFDPAREKENARELRAALAEEPEPSDMAAPIAVLEGVQESAAEVTDQIARAENLFRAAVSGRSLEPGVLTSEIDGLLDLFGRLDRAGRFEEELRVARVLNALLMLALRWLDLVRSVRALLRSASASDDPSGQAWALHQLGSLHLCVGDPKTAEKCLQDALQLEERIGEAGARCVTRHNLDCARRDRAQRAGVPRLLRLAGLATVLAIIGGGATTVAHAIGGGHDGLPVSPIVSPTPTLTVTPVGGGIVRGGGGIDCPGSRCTASFASGAHVRLVAVPGRGSIVVGWRGASCAGTTCTVTVDDNTTVVVVFGTRRMRDVRVVPSAVGFGSVPVGGESPERLVRLGGGSSALAGLNVAVDDQRDYRVRTNCPSRLAPRTSCVIHVVFHPVSPGAHLARLAIRAPGQATLVVALRGSAVEPAAASVTPTSLRFGSLPVGDSAPSRSITLHAGSDPLQITDVGSDDPAFSVASACPRPLPAGSTCQIEVTFAPLRAGAHSGTLSVAARDTHPLRVDLTGAGVGVHAVTVAFGVAPTSLDFGSVAIGSNQVVSQAVALTSGSGSLSITSIASDDATHFSVSHDCPEVLHSRTACKATVTFNPSAVGLTRSVLTVTTKEEGTRRVTLSGRGLNGAVGETEPASVDFGQIDVGAKSAPKAVTIMDSGTSPLAIGAPHTNLPSDYPVASMCPAQLPVGGRCTVQVSFVPTQAGQRVATLTIELPGSKPLEVALTGSGVVAPATLLPSSLDFGTIWIGRSSTPLTAKLTAGTSPLTIGSITSSDPKEFRVSTAGCPAALAPRASCDVAVVFSPAVYGSRQATLTVRSSSGDALTTGLKGNGDGNAAFTVDPSNLDFGQQSIGRTSNPITVTVTSDGPAPLTVADVSSDSTDFAQTNDCAGHQLAVGHSCTIKVTLAPSKPGVRTGKLRITSADKTTVVVTLSGTGYYPIRLN